MGTIVIGGGLIGLATARALSERGEDVTVIEAREDVALETSYANGGLLTPSLPEPWNGPGVYRHMAASLFDPRSSMKLRPRAIPSLFSWGIAFLRNSTPARYYTACEDNYRLATYSLEKLKALRNAVDIEYSGAAGGTLSVFRTARDFEVKLELSERLGKIGMQYDVLDTPQAVALVPQLEDVCGGLSGAIHFPEDEFGDARYFCQGLARELLVTGVPVETGVSATHIMTDRDSVAGVATSRGDFAADRVVVAAGVWSAALLKPHGVQVPVKPAKGYSVTVDVGEIDDTPRIPVLDDTMHAGVVPLDSRLRMVGTAEFAGYNTRIEQVRVDNLLGLLEKLFPRIAARIDRGDASPWTGLRPMTSDGKPIIDACNVDGLFVNTGHGPLGWTLALGSGHLLADTMLGRTPDVDPAPFVLGR